MCQTLTRRGVLRLCGGGAALGVAGCDGGPNLVSDGQVEAMGLQAWEEMRSAIPASQNRDLQGALNDVGVRLLDAAGADPADWEMVVFASPEINAFALPGNKIGIFEGMFEVIRSEDQLAAVVGHEIGHIQAEHGQERMSAQVAQQAGLRFVALLLNLGDVQYAEEIAAALGLGIQYGLVLPYSRDQELEADRLGLVTMNDAGFAPEAAVSLWQGMDQATGNRAPEFLATHPAPRSRIEQIREMLPELT